MIRTTQRETTEMTTNPIPRALALVAAALLLAAALPAAAATYHVNGSVYAADPLPEGAEAPPNPVADLMSGTSPVLTADEVVGGDELYATGILSMVRVEAVDASANTVLGSGVALLGSYYLTFNHAAFTVDVVFRVRDAATGDLLHTSGETELGAGTNKRYLLVPAPPSSVAGGVSFHPPGPTAYAFTRVGLVEAAHIGSDGLADFSGAAQRWRDAPFGGTLNVFGAASIGYYPLFGGGFYCYKVRATNASDATDWFYLDDPLYKRRYEVDTSTSPPTVTSTQEKLGPYAEAGGDCYRFTPLAEVGFGGNPAFWSFPDLLARWNTTDATNRKYDLTLEVYRRSDGMNQTVAGAALPLVVNNTPVELSFDGVGIVSGGTTTPLGACEPANLAGKQLSVEFTAHHPDGYLATYSLTAVPNLGASQTWASGSYSGSPFNGVNNQVVLRSASQFPESCSYALHLHAWARTTNGYGRLFRRHLLETRCIDVGP